MLLAFCVLAAAQFTFSADAQPSIRELDLLSRLSSPDGQRLRAEEKFDEAIALLEKRVASPQGGSYDEETAEKAGSLIALGLVHADLRNWERAGQALRQAMEVRSDKKVESLAAAWARASLGQIYSELGRFPEAFEHCRAALSKLPNEVGSAVERAIQARALLCFVTVTTGHLVPSDESLAEKMRQTAMMAARGSTMLLTPKEKVGFAALEQSGPEAVERLQDLVAECKATGGESSLCRIHAELSLASTLSNLENVDAARWRVRQARDALHSRAERSLWLSVGVELADASVVVLKGRSTASTCTQIEEGVAALSKSKETLLANAQWLLAMCFIAQSQGDKLPPVLHDYVQSIETLFPRPPPKKIQDLRTLADALEMAKYGELATEYRAISDRLSERTREIQNMDLNR